ncbi:secondary active sulfate transmembrane transporter [Aureococcus anophagefferens]|nr:secondary active sulfate transmembrane transporter [Aureococcus anophagefferens]
MGFPCMAYALVTGSPWASIGVTSITALMARTALADAHEALDEEAYVAVYACFAVAVGVASVALAALGLGGVAVERIPGAVKAGFKLGFGCAVISSQCATALFAGGKRDLAALLAGDDGAFGAAAAALAAFREASPALGGLLAGALPTLRVLYAVYHPASWSREVVAVAAVVLLGTLHGKKLLPRGAPPGVEVLVLVGAAALYSEQVGYGGASWARRRRGGAPGRIVAPWALPWDRLVDLCFGGSFLKLALSAATFAAVDFLQSVSVCSP